MTVFSTWNGASPYQPASIVWSFSPGPPTMTGAWPVSTAGLESLSAVVPPFVAVAAIRTAAVVRCNCAPGQTGEPGMTGVGPFQVHGGRRSRATGSPAPGNSTT